MQRCLQLAVKGEGFVVPNPLVGAVLVHNDVIIGEGYHARWGGPHAEVECLQSVAENDQPLIQKATLYVSLEPCAHYGKTPPCADLKNRKKIPKVIVGCADPFEKVRGQGIQKLRDAGIDVTVGILEKESRLLNRRFITFYEKSRPYVILKWAQTANGFMGNVDGTRLKISSAITDRLVHRWRAQNAAILVGTTTALQDDPELTTRLWPGRNPIRLVLDKELRLPQTLKLFDRKTPALVFNYRKDETLPNLRFYKMEQTANIAESMVAAAYNAGVQSILIEGGAQMLQAFIDAGLWDEAYMITNNALAIETGVRAPILVGGRFIAKDHLDGDVITTFVQSDNSFY